MIVMTEEIERDSTINEEEGRLVLVDRLSRMVLSCASGDELGRRFVDELRSLMAVDWAAVALIDRANDAINLSPLSSEVPSTLDPGNKMLLAGTPVAWVAENKRTLVEPDLTRESQFWTGILWLKRAMRSLVYLPLFWQREVYAVVVIGSTKPATYQERELKLLRYAASQFAIPLKGFQLAEETQKRKQTSVILYRLLNILTAGPDLTGVFPQFARELGNIIPFDRLALVKIDSSLRVLAVASKKETHPEVNEVLPIKGSAVPWLLKNRKPNVEVDFAREGQFPVNQLHLREGLRSEIRLPLFSQERLFASLHLSRYEPYSPSAEEVSFLEELAQFVSSPFQNYLHALKEKESLDWFQAMFHYTRTPLTPIVSSSKLLAEELEEHPQGLLLQLAQNVREAAQNLQENVNLFEKVTQLQSFQAELNAETLSPRDLLTEAGSYALPRVAKNSQLLLLAISPDLPQISADTQKLEQVLRILLDTAIKRSPPGTKIELRARVTQGELVIEVVDSGPVFTEEEVKSLTEPYYPSRAGHLLFPELSLSLAICRHIVELHGGRFWLESEPDGETTFSFSLPLISPERN